MTKGKLAGVLLSAVTAVAVFGRPCWATNTRGDQRLAAAARRILEPWREAHAQPTERRLHIVCWTPSDREFPANHRDRLSRMLLHIQAFYAEEMERNGFGERSFKLQKDEDGRVAFHEVRGSKTTDRYGMKSGNEIREESLEVLREAGIEPEDATIAIFCNLATWDDEKLSFVHNSPYYAGGNYRRGTAWQLDSPELDALNLSKTAPMIVDGQYGRISLGKHNSIFIGGMAHELGHAFGLPHVTERPDESIRGTALMGSGNRTYGDELRGEGRGTFLSFAHALRLASHPLFCGRLETEELETESTLEDLNIRADGKAIAVSGTIRGEPPIYGVVAYFDPEGNADYNQTSATAIPDSGGRFELQSNALTPGKNGILHLVPLHANGDVSDGGTRDRMRYSYRIADDGTPDLTDIQTRQALAPVIKAIDEGNDALARSLAGMVKDSEAAIIAAMLTDSASPSETPAEYRGASERQDLTHFKPNSASVGWARPAFNRVPDASLLLESNGELYSTGIYAHAPARHEYSLGGRWKNLQGSVGIAAGHEGSVRFEIKGDGRSLWQSPIVRPDGIKSFNVDVKGVELLELITTPTEDGTSNDWGLWLEPQLVNSSR